jgi:hypothetical protein
MAGGNKGGKVEAKLKGDIISLPVYLSTTIYRGTAVAIDSSGYAVPCGDTSGHKFMGIAEEKAVDATGVSGAATIRVRRHGIFKMVKNTTSAVTDVGQIAYMVTTHTVSVDEKIGLYAVPTYKVAVGLIVRREPDVPGGSTYTSNYLMVDITPSPWAAMDLTTHAALADQTAHTDSAIAGVVDVETSATPTITAAEFYGRLVTCGYAGTNTFTLPTSGVAAGTQCRFVKVHATTGALIITGGTLTGPQVVANVFTGCPYLGDSVTIECVSANVYQITELSQYVRPVGTDSTGTATVLADEFNQGLYTATYNSGATALTLATTLTKVGALCRFVNAHAASFLFTVTGGTLVGAQTASNVFTGCPNNGDSVLIQCVGTNSFRVVSVSQARVTTDYTASAVSLDDDAGKAAYVGGSVTLSYAGACTCTLPATGVPARSVCTIRKTGSAGLAAIGSTTFVGAGTTSNATTTNDAIQDVVVVENIAAASYKTISLNVA